MASSMSKGLSMHVAAVSGVFSPYSAKYFVNMFAPYPQPTAISVVHGLALLIKFIAVETSSLSAAVNNLHKNKNDKEEPTISCFWRNIEKKPHLDLLLPLSLTLI